MASLMELRAHARGIFMAGVKSADPVDGIKTNVRLRDDYLQIADRSYRLSNIRNILVVGCGKAAAKMALAIEDLLGDRVSGGIVVVKYGYALSLERIKVVEAGHPIPDEAGVDGAHQIIELVRTAGENDLVLFLISGGGSALLPGPADGLTLAEKQRTTQMLLQSGATIQEVNAVRKTGGAGEFSIAHSLRCHRRLARSDRFRPDCCRFDNLWGLSGNCAAL